MQRSFRLTRATADLLDRAADQSPLSRNALADRLLGEALRLERHPLIRYRQGYSGRRQACVNGSRLYIHQAVASVRDSTSVPEAAAMLGIEERLLRAAIAFAAEFPDEIEDDARTNQRFADEERARWEREQRAAP